MSVLADIRDEVATALTVVLPGRVHPYRPDRLTIASTPMVWVDRVDTTPATVGSGPPATGVDVTVIAVVDGATHAAQAMRDELHAACHDALRAAGFRWAGASSTTFAVSDDVTLPSLEIAVSRVVYTTTLCPPEPVVAVPIPPPVLEKV